MSIVASKSGDFAGRGGGKQVNLVEISEMLKAEPIIENGRIARFSKELNKDKK